MQAPARPRRSIRRKQRMRGSSRAISFTRAAVPSGLSSSTKMISHASPARAFATDLIVSTMLSISLKVGIMIEISALICICQSTKEQAPHWCGHGCRAEHASSVQKGLVTPTRGRTVTTHPRVRFCLTSGAMRPAGLPGFDGSSSVVSITRNMQTAQFEIQRE